MTSTFRNGLSFLQKALEARIKGGGFDRQLAQVRRYLILSTRLKVILLPYIIEINIVVPTPTPGSGPGRGFKHLPLEIRCLHFDASSFLGGFVRPSGPSTPWMLELIHFIIYGLFSSAG